MRATPRETVHVEGAETPSRTAFGTIPRNVTGITNVKNVRNARQHGENPLYRIPGAVL